MIKKHIGRPTKVTIETMDKLANAIQNNYNVSDACRYARISRNTFYRYLNNEPIFTEKIITAYRNQTRFVPNFKPMY